jgi:hypothetical protein
MRNNNNEGQGLKHQPMAEGRDTGHWAQRETRRLGGGQVQEQEGESRTLQYGQGPLVLSFIISFIFQRVFIPTSSFNFL